MAKSFGLKLVGPEGVLAEAEVESLVLPGAAGSLGVLPGHEPWTVLLKKGAVSFKKTGGGWENVEIASGVASIEPAKTIILADKAE